MSKPKQKTRVGHHRSGKLGGGRRRLILAITSVAVVGVVFAVVTLLRQEPADFRSLNGRWLRPDGGYILEIQTVDASGKIDAAYLNPRPITISKAQATRDGSTVKVFVELRAPNYPGSRYTLTYDRQRDQLEGTYFQAVERQNFNVVFGRLK